LQTVCIDYIRLNGISVSLQDTWWLFATEKGYRRPKSETIRNFFLNSSNTWLDKVLRLGGKYQKWALVNQCQSLLNLRERTWIANHGTDRRIAADWVIKCKQRRISRIMVNIKVII